MVRLSYFGDVVYRGYIKVWRKTLESDMYKSLTSVQRDIFISLLLLANHSEKTWEWKGETYTCKPGQFVTSLDSIIRLCAKRVSVRNTRTALDKFAKWQFLTNESTKTGRLITILNWETYQSKEEATGKDNGRDPAETGQSTGSDPATNKNDKNDKNDKNKECDESHVKSSRKKFQKPTQRELQDYATEIQFTIFRPADFLNYYDACGWMVGRHKMKDWKAALRTWKGNSQNQSQEPIRLTGRERMELYNKKRGV